MTKNAQKPRKVVFVSTMAGVPWGGSEDLWSRAALRLRSLGHEVSASLYEWPSRPAAVEDLISAGVKVGFRPRRKRLPGRLLEKCFQRFAASPLDRAGMAWLKKEGPDLVVVSQGGPWDGLPWMEACRELGLRYCPIVQANSELWWPLDEWLAGIGRSYSGAAKSFFVSHANRRLMEMQCGMKLEHAEVVSNPWNVDANREVSWPEDDGVARIACVGRLDPRAKGQDVLLEVLALPKWRERPVQLNLYGSGPCRESLEALCGMLDLRGVRFAGQVKDIGKLWSENHALILPSRFEGLPLVIVEAMLCGRPVITSNVAGNAEYLRDGINGFVAEAPTRMLLDDALERAWSRRNDWKAMGMQARRDILEVLPADPIGLFSEKLISLVK